MRVFICEFETGGGVRREDLPLALLREGALMRDALARDLADLGGVELITTHDDRLPAPAFGESVAVSAATDVWALWRELAETADAAWIVAPEYGGALARMAAVVRSAGTQLVGPDDVTIRIASSKFLTAEALQAHGVPTPEAWRPEDVPQDAPGPFVTKPDDGAGCERTRLVATAAEARAAPADCVVQRFVAGEPASLTILRTDDEIRILAANRQHVVVSGGDFAFAGVSVGALDAADETLVDIARQVTDALPGLSGIFGVDVILAPEGPVVIEVNPRITTAYAGLREAIGVNPASLAPPFRIEGAAPKIRSRAVEVAL